MANPLFILVFSFIFICNLHTINSSSCTLDFNKFPYGARGDCFDIIDGGSNSPQAMYSCCHLALQPVFQAMAIRTNLSRSIFLGPAEAQDCSVMFQDLHNQTSLSNCRFQDFISSSTTKVCSRDVNSVIELLGVERYNVLRSNCSDLSMRNYSDDACFSCMVSYRRSLKALEEVKGGEKDGSNRRMCAEALLVTLASSDMESENWIKGIFSCLWDEIEFPWPPKHKTGSLLESKKLLAAILVSLSLVIVAPILYKITRKRLRNSSEKEIENLSVIVLKKALEDEYTNVFYGCDSGLYIFSQDEIAKATNYFNKCNLIGEGRLGKVYLGIMPSEMRVTIKRINEGKKLHDFFIEISKIAKIKHQNLVNIVGYCDRGEQCLVYEYCVNGDLASWLLGGDLRAPVLAWEQRLQIAIDVARGLRFLHNNPMEKMVHGNIKLSNILLNERLEAKLSDFTLNNGLGTVANDVFNFGVVLLQLLTGKCPFDLSDSTPRSLVNEARKIVTKGENIYVLADPCLTGKYNPISFQCVLSIAVLCTTPSEGERPNLEEVLQKLQPTQNHT